MIEKTKWDLIQYYLGYWIVKLELDKKYKFNIKKDNRIDCFAYVLRKEHYTYDIRFNTKKLTTKWKIIHVVLHELGHIFYDFRTGLDAEHEFQAEYFALLRAKEHYPEYYTYMINWTKNQLKEDAIDEIHRDGYTKALQKLGEL